MIARLLLVGALLIASAGYLLSNSSNSQSTQRQPYIQGRNKTVLFFANKEHGISNVLVATASALLENYPDIEVHYASFSGTESKLQKVSAFARAKTPSASDIVYHEISGPSFVDATQAEGIDLDKSILPPGYAGIDRFTSMMQFWLAPYTVEDHMSLYEQMGDLIRNVDPAVVVLDSILRPAIDVTRHLNRQHAFITPNTLVDNFIAHQPYGRMFWKYPAITSGFKYPVPLRNIPENIYLNLRFIYSCLRTPQLAAKKAELRKRGLSDPINFFALHRDDVPWVTMTTEGATIPVEVVPPNVTCAGPIVLSVAPAAEQDPELAAWVKKRPTMLVNLGSGFFYSEDRATKMGKALAEVLEKTDVQVVWKMKKQYVFSDEYLAPLQPFIDSDRVKLSKWLTVDPTSLLETGDIVLSVHHGGSNCYHEAIGTGVPQLILPLWADLYNFAALAETIGVGAWACPETSPEWTAGCLRDGMLRALDGGEESLSMRDKAKQLGQKVQAGEKGRDIAAQEVAKLAYVR